MGAIRWKCAWPSATWRRARWWTPRPSSRRCGWPIFCPLTAVTDSSNHPGKRLGSNVIKGEVPLLPGAPRCPTPNWRCRRAWPPSSVPARPAGRGRSGGAGMEVDVYATGPVSTTKLVGGALILATSAASNRGRRAEWVTLGCRARAGAGGCGGGAELGTLFRAAGFGWQHAIDGSTGRGVRDSAPEGQEAAEPSVSAEALWSAPLPRRLPLPGQPAALENGAMGKERTYDEAQALLALRPRRESTDGGRRHNLAFSVLEELAVEVCAEAVSASAVRQREHFDFVWVSCCEGAEPINLAAACKRDSLRRPSIL